MPLTSAKNPLLQTIRRAARAGRPTDDGLIVAEGPHLVEEAMRGKWRVEEILLTPEGRMRYAGLVHRAECEVIEVSARAFASTAATESTQEVLALVRPCEWAWSEVTAASALVVVLDGIQDPGNAGTIVRSAEAFGATGVVLLKGCAGTANGKLLRASAGSIFRIPFLEGIAASELVAHIEASKLTFYALLPSGEMELSQAEFRGGCALAVGSEGAGVSTEIAAAAQGVRVPTGRVESLNVAIACSIALFSAQQQRSAA